MTQYTLAALGWPARSAAPDPASGTPARILSVARNRIDVQAEAGQHSLSVPADTPTGDYAVGDWVLFDPDGLAVTQLLDRSSLLQRKTPGREFRAQLIAANIDTLGIVTSCNADFSVARLERYLAMAGSAGCLPLIILTRADELPDPEPLRRQAEAISPLVAAIALDARDSDATALLAPWCKDGQTLALVGSSGVGKTTLSNGLTGRTDLTQDIRDDDAKGRHTTTARMLRPTIFGGWLADTPGMRELGMTDASEGIGTVFPDLDELATRCRFSDCSHNGEPGCAIEAGIAAGRLDGDRVGRWDKLLREDARNSESAADRRARGRAREKLYDQGRAQGRYKRGH